jgi:hypothetical protein
LEVLCGACTADEPEELLDPDEVPEPVVPEPPVVPVDELPVEVPVEVLVEPLVVECDAA